MGLKNLGFLSGIPGVFLKFPNLKHQRKIRGLVFQWFSSTFHFLISHEHGQTWGFGLHVRPGAGVRQCPADGQALGRKIVAATWRGHGPQIELTTRSSNLKPVLRDCK